MLKYGKNYLDILLILISEKSVNSLNIHTILIESWSRPSSIIQITKNIIDSQQQKQTKSENKPKFSKLSQKNQVLNMSNTLD